MKTNEMVERLAKRQAEHFGVVCDETRREDARWWLNALADEILLEAVASGVPEEKEEAFEQVAFWIQGQAKDST